MMKTVITLHYKGQVIQQWYGFPTEVKIQEGLDWIFDRVHVDRKFWRERRIRTTQGHLARIWESHKEPDMQIVVGVKNEQNG